MVGRLCTSNQNFSNRGMTSMDIKFQFKGSFNYVILNISLKMANREEIIVEDSEMLFVEATEASQCSRESGGINSDHSILSQG